MRSFGANYFLYRDRKALVANLAVVLGYVVVLYWAGIFLYNRWNADAEIPHLVEVNEPWFKLAAIVLAMFTWRIANRVASTTRIYNPLEGLMAIPRLFVANFINFCATVMAIKRFIVSKISGEVPAWGKTEHAWPSEEQMRKYHRKLGDLLMERRLVTASQLEDALKIQREKGGKLGEILVDMGVLWEEDVVHTIAAQDNRKSVEIDPYARPELRDLVSREIAESKRVYPVDMQGNTLVLAKEADVDGPSEREMEAQLGRPVLFRLTSGADIDFAIQRGYELQDQASSPESRLGQRLLRDGALTQETLTEALRRQKRSNRRLGDILVEMDVLSAEQLERLLTEQK